MLQASDDRPLTVLCPTCKQTREPDFEEITRLYWCPTCKSPLDRLVSIEKKKRGLKLSGSFGLLIPRRYPMKHEQIELLIKGWEDFLVETWILEGQLFNNLKPPNISQFVFRSIEDLRSEVEAKEEVLRSATADALTCHRTDLEKRLTEERVRSNTAQMQIHEWLLQAMENGMFRARAGGGLRQLFDSLLPEYLTTHRGRPTVIERGATDPDGIEWQRQSLWTIEDAIGRYVNSYNNKRALELEYFFVLDLQSIMQSATPAVLGAGEAPQEELGSNLFLLVGEVWKIRFDGGEIYLLRDSVGLRHLAKLLANPGKEIPCEEFLAVPADAPDRGVFLDSELSVKESDGDDERYEQYSKRLLAKIRKLRSERDEAQSQHTPEGDQIAGECQQEIDLVMRKAKSRKRRNRTKGEKNKPWAVTKAINAAIARIEKHDKSFASYLHQSIRTGVILTYYPPEELSWAL
jgi:hypothetical protein